MMQLGKVSESGQGLMGIVGNMMLGNNTGCYGKGDRTSGSGSKGINIVLI